jgi:hypothetical protein
VLCDFHYHWFSSCAHMMCTSPSAEAASCKVKKPVRSEFRTKTARQKRKSISEELVESKKQCIEKVDPCVIFSVPQFESRRDGTDRFQERKYLGLIEGVGGVIGKFILSM